ncbi:MAG: hypothetical protein ACEQSB_00550 [Undibacterium sp.]
MKDDIAVKSINVLVGEKIVEALKDEVFVVEGTPTATVLLSNGEYRKKPLPPSSEYMIARSYIGAKDQIIFVFEPVTPVLWSFVELSGSDLDKVFPTFSLAAATAFEVQAETSRTMLNRVTKLVADEFGLSQQELMKKIAKEYASHPEFGIF